MRRVLARDGKMAIAPQAVQVEERQESSHTSSPLAELHFHEAAPSARRARTCSAAGCSRASTGSKLFERGPTLRAGGIGAPTTYRFTLALACSSFVHGPTHTPNRRT